MEKKHLLVNSIILIMLGLGLTWTETAVSANARTETSGTTVQTETSGRTVRTETGKSGNRKTQENCSSDPKAKNFDPYCGLNRTK